MTTKFFADVNGLALELTRVYQERNKATGRYEWFGEPATSTPVWNRETQKWDRTILAVTRKVEMKRSPSRHECDARCLNAIGKIMRCECSCGGKNHGAGSALQCVAA